MNPNKDRLTATERARAAQARERISQGQLAKQSNQPVKDGVIRTGSGLIS